MHFVLSASGFVRGAILTLTSASATHSPFLVMTLIGLTLNSFALTLGLAILDPETKVSADSIIRRIFTNSPIRLDYRLMWQLASLSWKLRSFLFDLCRIYLILFRWIFAARHVLWSAYPAFSAAYPVVLALNRCVLAYFRVVLAAYRVVSAAYRLNSATSRVAAFVLVLTAFRVLAEEVVQLACLFARFVFASTTLSRKTYRLLLVCGASLVVLSWPRVKAAISYGLHAACSAVWAYALFQIARIRKLLLFLPFAILALVSRSPSAPPPPPPPTEKAIIPEGKPATYQRDRNLRLPGPDPRRRSHSVRQM